MQYGVLIMNIGYPFYKTIVSTSYEKAEEYVKQQEWDLNGVQVSVFSTYSDVKVMI